MTFDLLLVLLVCLSVAMASACSAQVTGTALGTVCVSFSNCPAACCTKTPTGCSGTFSTAPCDYPSGTLCNLDPCCTWGGIPIRCRQKDCTLIDPADCAGCGCTPSGTCEKIACSALTGSSNNPDVCAGCSTCPGNWIIDNNRGNLPWDILVTGFTRITTPAGYARAGYPGTLNSQSGIKWTPGAARFRWKPGTVNKFKD